MGLIDAELLKEKKFIVADTNDLTHEEFEMLVDSQPVAYDVEQLICRMEGLQEVNDYYAGKSSDTTFKDQLEWQNKGIAQAIKLIRGDDGETKG